MLAAAIDGLSEGGATSGAGAAGVRRENGSSSGEDGENRNGKGCHVVWTNTTERAPSVVPKVSLANGLIYTYTKDPGMSDPWYWTTLDFRTGRVVYKQFAGSSPSSFYNNNYAGIQLSRKGVEYLGTLGGLIALRDS